MERSVRTTETLDADTINDAKEEVKMAKQQLQRLRMQSRSVVDPAVKRELKKKLKKHEKSFSVQKRDLQRLETRLERKSMAAYSADMEMGLDPSDRLLKMQQTSKRTAERLAEARRVANATEASAQSSLDELYLQREVLLNSRNKAKETQDIVGQARRILGRMGRRNIMNNVLWYVLVIIAIVVLSMLLYVWLFR